LDTLSQPLKPQRLWALLAATLSLWLVTRPYPGVVQDARFYMVEALRAGDPSRFAHDLYFQFGSQGSFSIFHQFYRPLLALFGVGTTGIILTIIGQGLWLAGLLRLARLLVGPRMMWLSVATVIGIVGLYAPYFSYGEAFVTPRLYAEALTMLALALLPCRTGTAFALLVLAATLHPLMALPGLAVAFVWLAIGQPRWWLAAGAGVALVGGLAVAGVAPFANLLRTMDPAWLSIVRLREIQCFLTAWPRDSWVQVLQVLGWTVFALATARREHRRFLGAVLAVGLGGLGATWLGADLAHNVFVVEIQPWRALWLMEVVARIYIPLIFVKLLARSSLDSLRMATLLVMALILSTGVVRLLRYPGSSEFAPLSLVLEALTLAVIAAQLLLDDTSRLARTAAALAVVLIACALWRWDNRTAWTRFIEQPAPPPADLAALLPAKASVYWEGSVETLWLGLRHSSYFSCDQGTGAVFNRDTAMAYRHRSDSFWRLRTGDFQQSDACASFTPALAADRTAIGLAGLCAREPGLNYLILSAPLDGAPARTWRAPVRYEDIHMSDGRYYARVTDRFYIYACKGVSPPA
jgi:hypothetical protein